MSDDTITLYRLQGCPFCERVVQSLQDNGVEYESRFVEARHSRRDAVQRISGARTVPAIVDENTGVTMSESANIVEYVETTYGGRETEGETLRADGGN
ncbi:glutaredoxin [Halobacteriales archaeon QH_7_66_36]|nr:MAG: glutaredoxin [Halobacteriales archaeon QH_7_66_36]